MSTQNVERSTAAKVARFVWCLIWHVHLYSQQSALYSRKVDLLVAAHHDVPTERSVAAVVLGVVVEQLAVPLGDAEDV